MTTEKKKREPTEATKKAALVRAYYAALDIAARAQTAKRKAEGRLSTAIDSVQSAKTACEAAGFTINDA